MEQSSCSGWYGGGVAITVSLHTFVGSLWVLWIPATVQRRVC